MGTSIQKHHVGGESSQNEFHSQHRPHGTTVITDGDGQVQLQRMATTPSQRQQQVGTVQQEQQKNHGLVSMDEGEVYSDSDVKVVLLKIN